MCSIWNDRSRHKMKIKYSGERVSGRVSWKSWCPIRGGRMMNGSWQSKSKDEKNIAVINSLKSSGKPF